MLLILYIHTVTIAIFLKQLPGLIQIVNNVPPTCNLHTKNMWTISMKEDDLYSK